MRVTRAARDVAAAHRGRPRGPRGVRRAQARARWWAGCSGRGPAHAQPPPRICERAHAVGARGPAAPGRRRARAVPPRARSCTRRRSARDFGTAARVRAAPLSRGACCRSSPPRSLPFSQPPPRSACPTTVPSTEDVPGRLVPRRAVGRACDQIHHRRGSLCPQHASRCAPAAGGVREGRGVPPSLRPRALDPFQRLRGCVRAAAAAARVTEDRASRTPRCCALRAPWRATRAEAPSLENARSSKAQAWEGE